MVSAAVLLVNYALSPRFLGGTLVFLVLVGFITNLTHI